MSRLVLSLSLAALFAAVAYALEDDNATVSNPATDGFSMKTFTAAFGESFGVIMATEIGDRTFFIAAIMAMRHSRFLVWSGAACALVVMTVLSTIVGHMAPMLIPKAYTHYAAAGLFLFFGAKMLREGATLEHSGASEELEEVEAELSKKQDDPPDDEEAGGMKADVGAKAIFIQAFTLTFVAEWGDRSQIATIALGAAKEPFGVTLGASIGHSFCTGMAVIGGKLLASRISERSVLLTGGFLFVLFGVVALFTGPSD